jgi:hypothetical protein
MRAEFVERPVGDVVDAIAGFREAIAGKTLVRVERKDGKRRQGFGRK